MLCSSFNLECFKKRVFERPIQIRKLEIIFIQFITNIVHIISTPSRYVTIGWEKGFSYIYQTLVIFTKNLLSVLKDSNISWNKVLKVLQIPVYINSGSRYRPDFKQLEQAIQYTYRLFKEKRDCTPNDSAPFRYYNCNIKIYCGGS